MIKQITLENLYNFKEEITLDFDTSGKEGTSFNQYNKDKISNFSLIYGKNNVGKSNFFRALKEATQFIKEGRMSLSPYYPQIEEVPSVFEIIIENENHEVRYGFELLIKSEVISDEWMYAKINHYSRESLIFNRESFKIHVSINKSDSNSLLELKETTLFLNYFNSINHNYEIINDFMKAIHSLKFVDCVNTDIQEIITDNVFTLVSDQAKRKLFNQLLEVADLDIEEVLFEKLGKKQLEVLEKLKAILELELDVEEKDKLSQNIIEENIELIPSLLNKDVISVLNSSKALEARSIEFIHKNGASFRFKELSSGTKQIINLLSIVVLNMSNPSVFIFDEIETGLHYELIDFAMNFFKFVSDANKELQYIVTTHQASLLDYDYISNDNKMFLKYSDEIKSPVVEYVSEYKLRDYQQISQRYNLGAFGTNPNTSRLYELKRELEDIRLGGESL